ncbi:T9SS sorting signal type C domain-containing protein [Flavobacterium sp. F372]|uniref:T9SS sorting signal type C domain-containing protein n=1 Tax=Flavobacterium bernardetii TaxID=2813823 RepID=A0ABR7IZ60_9FLAO|nr:PA domain-containing protein [Flavobacterium bernardetii]MBC5835086.1 T9SS sorting signal type C domain-containing protein [Flavobacterium bernardetii]NHF70798.1 T9SS sorting signal type C domain-containing protein [Flavobacterium bernardetii]
MKSKLLKFGLLFFVAIVVSIVTFSVFSDSEKVKSNSLKDVPQTNDDLVVEEKQQDVTTKNYIVDNQKDNFKQNVVSKVQILSEKHSQLLEKPNQLSEIDVLRKKHQEILDKEFFKKTFLLSKSERKAEGLPPNKYFEQDYALTANPTLGRPTGENLAEIRVQLENIREAALTNRTPGDGADNPWIERGPNNVGGRTKALIFDPTDATNKTVIAGGVSGGLWKNTDITVATAWTRMALPENLNVLTLVVDPISSSTWYAGTGESYTGDVVGNGIWKTTDAGKSWYQVFGGGATTSTQYSLFNLTVTSSVIGATNKNYVTSLASFGDPIPSSPIISAQIALVNDGTAPTDDACSLLPANSMAGKIALIRRGTCTFESKVLQAEAAGAVAVIIMNNVAGGGVLGMADSGLGVTIPSLMVSKEDGDLLVAGLSGAIGTFNPTLPGQFNGNGVVNVQLINDIAIKNNGGVSEIYAAVGDGFGSGSYLNHSAYGVYKSINGGATWTKLNLPTTASGNQTCPMDIEIAVGGKIWVSSTHSTTFNDGGGKIFVSTDNGATFTEKHSIVGNGGGARVEIEASHTTADKIYVLSQLDQADPAAPVKEVQLLRTLDGFNTAPTVLPLPGTSPGTEARLTTYGFTGAQAFYDLFIESDPTNDANVFVGGINIHRSTNSGAAWTQITSWGSDVHSDQHAMTFRPGTPNSAIFGNDGGVYYCASLSAATLASGTDVVARNTGFNVTQFVGVAVLPGGIAGNSGDFFVAGAQDNGSNSFPQTPSLTVGAAAGVTGSLEIQGGDGGIPLYSQDTDEYMVTNYVYNDNVVCRPINNTGTRTLNDATVDRGLFYSAFALDSANDIVYSDFSDSATRIYYIRRYINIKSGTVTRVDLTNALLTSYPTAISPGKVTATTLYVGTANGKLLKIINANTVTAANSASAVPATSGWSEITGPSFVGSISDIAFGANDSQIFVTMSNYGVTSIWYTLNGGTNWYSLEGNLPDLPVRSILQNPLATNELMIGTELGVWYTIGFNPATSATQALTWHQSFNGMSNVKVTDLDLQPNSPTAPTAYTVYAATYGRGVFSSQLWFCGATSTTWNGSAWSAGVPTSKTAVVFSRNYTSTASLDACSVTVNTGVAVTFATGHTLRVGDNITVNGTGSLTINNDAALIQHGKHAVNTGNIIVKRNSASMVRLDYTAWSSPVSGQQLQAFSPSTVATRFYQYLYTGTTTPTAYQAVTATNNFVAGKGYMIRSANNWPVTATVFNGQFTGVPNNGIITQPIGLGYNLLGNPYASPISSDEFIVDNGFVRTLYFWTHTAPASGGIYPTNNYASYTLLGGVASASGGAIPNNKIQVGQGFFVNSVGAYTAKFTNEMREDAITTTQFFKGGNASSKKIEEEKHRVWLNLNSKTTPINQILIGYIQGASPDVDEKIDGKMLDTSNTMLYNFIDNKEYVIQGKGLPFTDQDIVKLGLKDVEAGDFEINIEQVDGLFAKHDVFIKDKYTNAIHNLKEGSYFFTSPVGTFNDRFEVVYKTTTKEEVVATNTVDVLVKNDILTIKSYQSEISSIEVYDVLGKLIFTKSGINSKEFNTNQLTSNNQALIVKIQLKNGEILVKKTIL